MNLAGLSLVFLLTPEGSQALGSFVGSAGSLTGHVVGEGDPGVWIAVQDPEAVDRIVFLLLKWDYVVTAMPVGFPRESEPPTRQRIGF